jgi:hypothetical protein
MAVSALGSEQGGAGYFTVRISSSANEVRSVLGLGLTGILTHLTERLDRLVDRLDRLVIGLVIGLVSVLVVFNLCLTTLALKK